MHDQQKLISRAEHKIRKAMFKLREETNCDLNACHMAMLIGSFNVMKSFSVDDIMFKEMYESTMTNLEEIFASMKKQTHDNPGNIQ